MRKIEIQNTYGFTILEIAATMSLFTVVMLLTGSIFVLAQQSYNRSVNKNELIQNVRVCMDRLSRELRQANQLITDTSTPTSTIIFQDGHDLDNITYIEYYLDNTDFKRACSHYYFDADPEAYVYCDSVDAFGNPPNATTTEDRIIGEYFSNLIFSDIDNDGLIDIGMDLEKNNITFDINTKIYIRDW